MKGALRKITGLAGVLLGCSAAAAGIAGCGDSGAGAGGRGNELRIFHAAGFTPVLDDLRDEVRGELGIRMQTEASGSLTACRKVEELGRNCDLLILADKALVADMLEKSCSWRIDFATDEIVLGVGARAPAIDAAEQDWAPVLLREDVRFGRVDENQAPLGYRTLLTLILEEKRRDEPGLADEIANRSVRITDDANRLAPMLRSGDLDYAFMYRSICTAMDIRYIKLSPEINLGSADIDYSAAEVTFEKLSAGRRKTVTVRGAPSVWTLTIPDRGADVETALRFVEHLLTEKIDLLRWSGFEPLDRPLYFGAEDGMPFEGIVFYGGQL